MGKTVLVRVTVDASLKRRASAVLKKMGLTLSDAIRILMFRIAKDGKLPFEPLTPSRKTVSAIKKAQRSGYKSFNTAEEMMADLHSDN